MHMGVSAQNNFSGTYEQIPSSFAFLLVGHSAGTPPLSSNVAFLTPSHGPVPIQSGLLSDCRLSCRDHGEFFRPDL